MKIQVPGGATDTHIHIYDSAAPAAKGTFMPGHFPVSEYKGLQKKLGLQRVVVVQPNAYAYDNSVTLAAIRELGAGARGVAVVRPEVGDQELERLTKGGIRALRIMTLHGGTLGFDVMDRLMARVHPFGWHANIQLDGRGLPEIEEQIRRLPGKFVIDHTGKYLEPVSPEDESFKSLLRLVDGGRCWVKLSAPYETSKTGGPKFEDVGRLAKALVKRAPDRMLWASNWPHPSSRQNVPDDVGLLELLLDWAPDEKTRKKILSDNPAELYGF